MTGVVTLLRPGAPLTWLRVRLPVPGATAAHRQAHAHLLRAALPELPLGATPLHARMAHLGALFSVSADGHGIAVYVTVTPERLAAAVDLLQAAITTPLPAELAGAAAGEVGETWQWVRADSDSLADLTADLALHSDPAVWPTLHRELGEAMEGVTVPPGGLGATAVTLVAPQPPGQAVDQALAALTTEPGRTRTAGPHGEPVTLHLPVASEQSVLIRLAWRTPPRTHPDFPALAVAARILGGHYRSRLMRAFRQDRGWSYSPWAMLRSAAGQGLWQVSVRVAASHSREAITRIGELITGYAPTPPERVSALAHTIAEQRTLWSSGESRLTLSGYWQDLGLRPDHERVDWPHRVSAVTAGHLDDAVRRHLSRPPDLTMILSKEETDA
ncbi:M16 family metallopeptidase [Micromonospora chokoriensis]